MQHLIRYPILIVDNPPRLQLAKQGRRHKGNQAARRPRMMCSICDRRFTYDPSVWGYLRGDWDERVRHSPPVYFETFAVLERVIQVDLYAADAIP